MHRRGLVSIWFFVGVLLAIYGLLILGAGIYQYLNPPAQPLVLAEYHAGIWWGILLLALGAFYSVKFRPGHDLEK